MEVTGELSCSDRPPLLLRSVSAVAALLLLRREEEEEADGGELGGLKVVRVVVVARLKLRMAKHRDKKRNAGKGGKKNREGEGAS